MGLKASLKRAFLPHVAIDDQQTAWALAIKMTRNGYGGDPRMVLH
jgi:hypothetical protein